MITKNDFWECAKVEQHSQFQKFLEDIVFDKERREQFYLDLIDIDYHLDDDLFRQYFEEYSAERKSNQQDFSPQAITKVVSRLTDNDSYNVVDFAAGTGSLLVEKWERQRKKTNPFEYYPSNYFYYAQELSDSTIPYLIHNLAIRGMNAVVVHGNTLEKEVKQIYFISNDKDDPMSFSSINVMPHSEEVAEYFGVKEWLEEEKKHVESPNIVEEVEEWQSLRNGATEI